jgi:hypothetical protein
LSLIEYVSPRCAMCDSAHDDEDDAWECCHVRCEDCDDWILNCDIMDYEGDQLCEVCYHERDALEGTENDLMYSAIDYQE